MRPTFTQHSHQFQLQHSCQVCEAHPKFCESILSYQQVLDFNSLLSCRDCSSSSPPSKWTSLMKMHGNWKPSPMRATNSCLNVSSWCRSYSLMGMRGLWKLREAKRAIEIRGSKGGQIGNVALQTGYHFTRRRNKWKPESGVKKQRLGLAP